MPIELLPALPLSVAEAALQTSTEAEVARAISQANAEAEQVAKAMADAQKAMNEVLAQTAQGGAATLGPAGSPALFYKAQVAARREVLNQLRSLENRRDELARDITRATQNGNNAAVPGLELRLKVMDARIASLDAQVAQANLNVARAAAIPGSIQPDPPPPPRQGPPEEVYALGGLFIVAVFFPIAIAYARRLWKRGSTIIAPVPADVRDRLENLTQAVEAIGIEVERIGEGQRFVTRVLGESRPVEHQLPVNRHVGVE
jgi:hypothetical protein